MKKKILALLMAAAMTASLVAGCGSTASSDTSSSSSDTSSSDTAASTDDTASSDTSSSGSGIAADQITVGGIYVGDENEGYTEAHMNGIKEMAETLGLSSDQVIEKTNIPEDESCYDAAVDLADQGCNIVFANSFGHESYMMQAAQEYPDVQFCHATGPSARTAGIANFHNYFTSVYESRYVSGIVAGLKLNQMIADGKITEDTAKMGYVGAYPYAEVISGFTSFYLGAKSVCPSVTMEVRYTNSWADISAENETAKSLIADGCVLISQHADTTGAPTACEAAGVPCVGYNVDMTSVAPNTALTSASIDWGPYYTYAVKCMIDGETIATDWCEGYSTGADKITPLNTAVCADGTEDAVKTAEDAIKSGSLHVFDTSTFTIGGQKLEDLIAGGGDYEKYAASVSDGYYHESDVDINGSAPSFDLIIDGITSITE